MVFSSILLFCIWFFPIFVAKIRNHNNFIPIMLVTLILGFTGIGYIVGLIWAFSFNTEKGKRQKIKNPVLLLIFTILVICLLMLSSIYTNTIFTEIQTIKYL